MSDIGRLIRVAARRNSAGEYTTIRFRALRSKVEAFRRRAEEEGVSGNVVLEAFLDGYVGRHPAVLAMVDRWVQDSGMGERGPHAQGLGRRDIEEIYAAACRGLETEEEGTDG